MDHWWLFVLLVVAGLWLWFKVSHSEYVESLPPERPQYPLVPPRPIYSPPPPPTPVVAAAAEEEMPLKRRGRPKGSKNKQKSDEGGHDDQLPRTA